MIRDYLIYAGVAGLPNDDPEAFVTTHYGYGAARAFAVSRISNPYKWVIVIDSGSGVVKLELIAQAAARIH